MQTFLLILLTIAAVVAIAGGIDKLFMLRAQADADRDYVGLWPRARLWLHCSVEYLGSRYHTAVDWAKAKCSCGKSFVKKEGE